MPRSNVLTSVNIDVEEKTQSLAVDPDQPFLILVAGNFSGGASRNRRPIQVDRDNFDQVMALLAPQLQLAAGGSSVAVSFRELDDFHPDRLFQRVAALREVPRETAQAPGSAATAANVSGADVLRMMMGESPAPAGAAPRRSEWDQMLHDLVAPYAEREAAPASPAVNATLEAGMRAFLHQPAFQELEAAWRGLDFLTRRLETGTELKVYLLDLPQSDLAQGPGLADLARALESQRFAVIAGIYYFAETDEELLTRLAAISQEANAPLLAGLAPHIVGLARVFPNLRQSAKARWVGLALPRFLLRLPYGKETSSIDSFAFEEMPSPPRHQSYLWGNPSLACAYLLGEAFQRYGWDLQPGVVRDIESLPAHVYREDGEAQLKPCAEVLLTEAAAEMLLERGIMPLASIKGSDRVRLVRFQSAANPAAPLAGQWD